MNAIKLYRPVGLKELELIMISDWRTYPPRLDWQPIFYPVLNQTYAEQIASQWNINDPASGYCGIVTSFDLLETHYSKFDIQNVGGNIHNELWVPAEALDEFNSNITGKIQAVKIFSASIL